MIEMGKTPVLFDEEQRVVIKTLQNLLRMIGDANDAEYHGFLDYAEQERKNACESIRELIAQHAFLVDLFPTIQNELDSRHILTFGWTEFFDRANAFLQMPARKL